MTEAIIWWLQKYFTKDQPVVEDLGMWCEQEKLFFKLNQIIRKVLCVELNLTKTAKDS